ncbi:MAG: hypothetical protein JXA24_05500 [Proteobacteria bacterium]|nr:hypothetical protein [Pseudomonadota bacterium]
MANARIHNALFALLVGLVLGITAWSLLQRSGPPRLPAIPELAPPAAKAPSRIERMIESGELSREPALFWGPEAPPPEGGGD